jgi:hypothetical protein
MKKIIWTLEEAQEFCASLQKSITGFGIGLTGSVLKKKESSKDLDIIVFPLSSVTNNDLEELRNQFSKFGMVLSFTREQVTKFWRDAGSLDEKHVEVWMYNRKRIDVFYLR